MIGLRNLTIKRKLVAILMLTSAAAILAAGTVLSVFGLFAHRRELVNELTMLADVTAHNCRAPLAFDAPEDAETVLSALAAKPSIVYACVLDAGGKTFASYGHRDRGEGSGRPAPPEEGHRFGGGYLHVSRHVELGGKIIGTVWVQGDMRELREALRRDASVLAVVIMLALAVAFVLSARLQRTVSRPILAVADLARAVSSEHDYSVRGNKETDDEVGLLVDSFNEMLTEIQQRDEALQHSEQRYRGIVEDQTELICRHLPDCTLTFVNDAYCRYFCRTSEELVGNKFLPLIHPEDQPEVEAQFASLSRGTPVATHEHRVIAPNGETRWQQWTNRAIFDKDGELTEFQGAGRDITERKRAEEETQRLRLLLKNMIDSMPSSLVAVDAEGRVTHWNRRAEETTGVSLEEAEGQLLDKVFPALEAQLAQVREAIRQREAKSAEKVESYTDGERHICDVMVYPLVTNGVEGAVIRIDDVTERVRLEEMMIQSEKMLSVGGIAAGMAHEINNPLAGIMQNVQVVLDRIRTELPANVEAARDCGINLAALSAYLERRKIPSLLESVRKSGQRAAKVIENVLSFSRKSDAHFSSHDLAGLLDKTVELAASDYDLKRKYDFRQIEIVREYDPHLPLVSCEETKIQQVILNLLKNGAQAMVEQEDRTEAPRLVLRTLRDGAMARIEVEDNGPGMTEEVRKRVFEPFFTTKGVGTGTGLGLSVSYFIVTENHGGTMSVESAPGQGARFIVHLPLRRKD